jgi:hypothetical protein
VKYNIATLEYVLSSPFIAACVDLSRKLPMDSIATELQYRYNQKFNFNRVELAKAENDVSITTEDVVRALSIRNGRSITTDEIGIAYTWLRLELPMLVSPSEDKAWAKFVAHVKEKALFGHFAHLSSVEVRRLFKAAYNALESVSTGFYA